MSSNEEGPRTDVADKPKKSRAKAEKKNTPDLSRRQFIKGAGIASVAASAGALLADRVLATP
ncbi:MAG: twin-arginine translocation signal domain-containing protein, partial [Candidatus Acidiferrales bacterium]